VGHCCGFTNIPSITVWLFMLSCEQSLCKISSVYFTGIATAGKIKMNFQSVEMVQGSTFDTLLKRIAALS